MTISYDSQLMKVKKKSNSAIERSCEEVGVTLCVCVWFLPAGVPPVYCSLFGLMGERDWTWFPPSHVFKLRQGDSERLHFRVRYA